MGHINTPPSLSSAQSVMDIAENLTKILDPKYKEKVAQDIADLHALNAEEAAKHDSARKLIKKHEATLAAAQTAAKDAEAYKVAAELDYAQARDAYRNAKELDVECDKKIAQLELDREYLDQKDQKILDREQAVETAETTNAKEKEALEILRGQLVAQKDDLDSKLAAIKRIGSQ